MATCRITTGIDLNCEAVRKVGGVKQRMWIANSLEGFSVTTDADGYVTALNFDAYGGLVKFTGTKNGHSGGSTVQITDGGNRFLQHNVQITLMPDTPIEDDAILELISGDYPMVLEDRNGDFFLYGATNGMTISEGTQNSGTEATSAIGDILTFVGEETAKPLRILDTNAATTLALLISYEV